MSPGSIPHARTVIAFCVVAIIGYGSFSVWAVFYANDATLTGDVVGTWKSFAVGAFGFWIGSSSAGKSKSEEPQPVTIEQPANKPVPVDQMPEPAFARFEEPKP